MDTSSASPLIILHLRELDLHLLEDSSTEVRSIGSLSHVRLIHNLATAAGLLSHYLLKHLLKQLLLLCE